MSRNLLSILQASDEYQVPNDMDGGSLIIHDEAILFIQKPKMVFIPREEVTVPLELPEKARKERHREVVNGRIEALLWAAISLQADLTCVSEHQVLEALQMQVKPSDRIVWLLANTQTAADAAARITTAYRAANAGPMEMMCISDNPWGKPDPSNIIIGTTNPVGYYLDPKTHIVKGEGVGYEVSDGNGWLVYAGKVAAVQLI
jgi:hypothetical protein